MLRRRIALAVAFALVLQAWLPLVPSPPGGTADALRSIVLCTAHGPRQVLVDQTGQPVEQPAPRPGAPIDLACHLCCMFGGVKAPLLAVPLAWLPAATAPAVAIAPACDAVRPVAIARAHRPRGPPRSV